MKILMVSPYPPPYGGVSHGTKRIMEKLLEIENIDVELFDTSPRWRRITDTRMTIRIIGGGLSGIKQLYSYIRTVNKFHPNIVYIRTSGSLSCFRDYVFTWIAEQRRIRTIYAIHMGRIPDLKKKKNWEWRWLKRIVNKAWRTVVLDRESLDTLRNDIQSRKILLIPNEIDPPPLITEIRSVKRNPRVIYLGWIIAAKGLRELADAWNALFNPDWELMIVGPGEQGFIEKIKGGIFFGLNVKFVGELVHEEAMNLLRDSEILVLPSYTEGFPNVVLEAMAFGIPVIGSRVGAIPAMIMERDGVGPCGLVIEPRDTNNLASALKTLMDNENLREELGVNGRARVLNEYSSNVVFARWLNLWAIAAEPDDP